MKLQFSPTFEKKLKTINHKDKKLSIKIHKQLKVFQINPHHPSLRLYKLKGDLKNVWSISVTIGFRLLFVEDNEHYFFDMGEHSEIYK